MSGVLWTPGPWTTEEGSFEYVTAAGEIVAMVDPGRPADARLIALAPEMADVLGVFERYTPTLMRVFGRHFPSLQVPLDGAHALLVRARGETA